MDVLSSLRAYRVVAISAGTYAALHNTLTARNTSAVVATRLVSSLHATVTTALVLYALRPSQWSIADDQSHTKIVGGSGKVLPMTDGLLDDSANPIIVGKCALANGLTAWEAGYLIYDTWAMFYETSSPNNAGGFRSALLRVLRTSPVFFVHHLALSTGLTYLQSLIASGYDVGIWIITAFLLMNASNPILNARWWVRRKTGGFDKRLDVAFIVVFAACRFGTVAWVLRRYGKHHGLGAWEAYIKLRLQCKAGTATLVGFNALWWFMLVRKVVVRELAKKS